MTAFYGLVRPIAGGRKGIKFDTGGMDPDAGAGVKIKAASVKVVPLNATVGALPAGAITGAPEVVLMSSNATPGAQTVRTAAQMMADSDLVVGQTWKLRITNSGAGTLTLTADGGATVTLTGTMTVATNTWRDFICTLLTASTASIVAVGNGTFT